MAEEEETPEIVDGTFQTPFTCLVVGPSGSGKSTFVADLIRNQSRLLSRNFDYVYIYTGTAREDVSDSSNSLYALEQESDLPHLLEVFDVQKMYLSDGVNTLEDTRFVSDLKALLKRHKDAGQEGCIIFDDLMEELAECNILTSLFSKISAHSSVSIIHITQNLFHKGGSKRASANVTVFRNTKLLVLFNTAMDGSVFTLVAQRINATSRPTKEISGELKKIAEEHRYVLYAADLRLPPDLRYRSDIFAVDPIPHQKVFGLSKTSATKRKRKGPAAWKSGHKRKRSMSPQD